MVQSVGLGIQVPDFGRSLAQGFQLRAASEQMEGQNALRAMLAQPGVTQGLLAGDPNILAQIAGIGPQGLQVAAPIMASTQQRQDMLAARAAEERYRERMLGLRERQIAAATAGAGGPATPSLPTLGNNERGHAAMILTTIAPRVMDGTASPDEIEMFRAAGEVWQRREFDPQTNTWRPSMALPPRAAEAYAFLQRNATAPAAPVAPGAEPTTTNTGSVLPPAPPGRTLTASEVTLRQETEDTLNSVRSARAGLQRALELSPLAYAGTAANVRGSLAGMTGFDTATAVATRELDNIMGTQALQQLKAIFGAAPTEGERKILLDLEASSGMSRAEREALIRRAIAAAERRERAAAQRLEEIVRGTFARTDPNFTAPTSAPPAAAPSSEAGNWSIRPLP